MSWNSQYKNKYKCKDPNLIITAVQAFPNMVNTVEKCNEFYKIDLVSKDLFYREIYAYLQYRHAGRDFIPIAFEDKVPKLKKLKNIGNSYFWCIAYKSDNRYIDYSTAIKYLKHYSSYHNDISNVFNQNLVADALRAYVRENGKDLNYDRKFNLIYNNNITIIKDNTVEDWIKHLEDLPNRNIYEIIFNEFY